MDYVDPSNVESSRDIDIVYDMGSGDAGSSIARLTLNNHRTLGIRWKADAKATWFIVPDEIANAVLKAASDLDRSQGQELTAGYQRMAADTEREGEAFVWSEALIGDAVEAR